MAQAKAPVFIQSNTQKQMQVHQPEFQNIHDLLPDDESFQRMSEQLNINIRANGAGQDHPDYQELAVEMNIQ